MIRRPTKSTRTYTLLPYTPLFRSRPLQPVFPDRQKHENTRDRDHPPGQQVGLAGSRADEGGDQQWRGPEQLHVGDLAERFADRVAEAGGCALHDDEGDEEDERRPPFAERPSPGEIGRAPSRESGWAYG